MSDDTLKKLAIEIWEMVDRPQRKKSWVASPYKEGFIADLVQILQQTSLPRILAENERLKKVVVLVEKILSAQKEPDTDDRLKLLYSLDERLEGAVQEYREIYPKE